MLPKRCPTIRAQFEDVTHINELAAWGHFLPPILFHINLDVLKLCPATPFRVLSLCTEQAIECQVPPSRKRARIQSVGLASIAGECTPPKMSLRTYAPKSLAEILWDPRVETAGQVRLAFVGRQILQDLEERPILV
jgi:hypothetical protein